jgi:hypothetical protein
LSAGLWVEWNGNNSRGSGWVQMTADIDAQRGARNRLNSERWVAWGGGGYAEVDKATSIVSASRSVHRHGGLGIQNPGGRLTD